VTGIVKLSTPWGDTASTPATATVTAVAPTRRAASVAALSSQEQHRTGHQGVGDAGELRDLFLAWLEKNRSGDTYPTRRTSSRFGSLQVAPWKSGGRKG
jgi:hypothetical protein